MGCGSSSQAVSSNDAPMKVSPPHSNHTEGKRQGPRPEEEDHVHDLSVGATLGNAEVQHANRSEVAAALCNTLALDQEDAHSLREFVSHNMSGRNELKEQVWHPRMHTAANLHGKPRTQRRLYVIWLTLQKDADSLSFLRSLDKLVRYSQAHEETENYSDLDAALSHFSMHFAPLHILAVVDDIYKNEEVVAALPKLPNTFRFLVADSLERRPSLGQPPTTARGVAVEVDGKASAAEEASTPEGPKTGPDFTILHFNDVYHIQATRTSNPVGGADRFQTALNRYKEQSNPLVLFSGDAFSPSVMSTVTKGSHMVPVLNQMGIHCAMYGNHDFDFGVDVAAALGDRMNFPWLLSNVLDGRTGGHMANSLATKVIEWAGRKIGILGLAEKEWIDTLPIIPDEGLQYKDFVKEGRKLANELRSQGCSVVIALTHMREPNDILLAEQVPEIDLVLGGHDHFYNITHTKSGVTVVKSGSEFRHLSYVEVFVHDKEGNVSPAAPPNAFKGERMSVTVTETQINDDITPDPDMAAIVLDLAGEINKTMDKPIGHVEVELDATFESARTRESNVGNFISDIIRRAYQTDIALICGGCIRSDNKYGPGPFTLKDVLLIFPFEDPCVVLTLTGQMIWDTLENGVFTYPKFEGRFPQVSGLRFVFDPDAEPGKRIKSVHVGSSHEPLDLAKEYTVATREYMFKGNDGFTALTHGKVKMDDEEGHLLSTLLRNYFWAVETVNRMHANKRSAETIEAATQSFRLHKHTPPYFIAPKVEGRIMTAQQAEEKEKAGHSPDITDLPSEIRPQFAQMKEMPRFEESSTGPHTERESEPTSS